MGEFLLGIDIGTTATKVLLIHKDGQIICSLSRPVDLTSLYQGWSEEDPCQWWDNVQRLIPELLIESGVDPVNIAAVGVTGMVPTLVCLDKNNKPLRYSIQQNDARATEEIEMLREKINQQVLLKKTGSVMTQQSIAPKLMWLSKHEPQVIQKTVSICGSYDYITRRLTGFQDPSTEINWALESGLYNYHSQKWDDGLLKLYNINKKLLGNIHRSHKVIGVIQSQDVGLEKGTPVIAGSADHVASAFSAGLYHDGNLLIKMGGAGDILLASSKPIIDDRLFLDYNLIVSVK